MENENKEITEEMMDKRITMHKDIVSLKQQEATEKQDALWEDHNG